MKHGEVVRAWGRILQGRRPSLSIEVTKECPLRCPGCYAYEPNHLGGAVTLRVLNDYKGSALVSGVLDLADRLRPLHISLVGGDPLVRYREMEEIVPALVERGIHVQIVTSAFRPIPAAWSQLDAVTTAVSIDGLQPDHDARRFPATYERITKNIAGQRITIHCTITGQMARREGSLSEFLAFWTPRPEVKRIWFSLFTPQVGDSLPEILTPAERGRVVGELLNLRREYPKLDMPEPLIRQFSRPPASPADCIFAQTTRSVSADLKTQIGPCQFGGEPDCGSCGCMASMGLAAIGAHRLGGIVPVSALFKASLRLGQIFGQHAQEF
jgi:organic radical activating enzyme